jgi:hypothetical protein
MAFDRDPKPMHAGGYPPEHAGLCEQTLVTLLRNLGPWKDGIYLAGGLVPRFLIGYPPNAEGPPPHVGTTDVDLVLSRELLAEVEAYETLEKNLKNLGFERGANDEGRRQNFSWVRSVGGGRSVVVDLLCDPSVAGKRRVAPIPGEKQLSALSVKGARLVYRDFLPVPVTAELLDEGGVATETVRVANIVPFIALKALAYDDRAQPKDAYDLVYCLSYYGRGPEEVAEHFAERMAAWPDETVLDEAVDALRRRFATDEHIAGEKKDGAYSYARFLHDPGRRDQDVLRRRNAASVIELFMARLDSLRQPSQ